MFENEFGLYSAKSVEILEYRRSSAFERRNSSCSVQACKAVLEGLGDVGPLFIARTVNFSTAGVDLTT